MGKSQTLFSARLRAFNVHLGQRYHLSFTYFIPNNIHLHFILT